MGINRDEIQTFIFSLFIYLFIHSFVVIIPSAGNKGKHHTNVHFCSFSRPDEIYLFFIP